MAAAEETSNPLSKTAQLFLNECDRTTELYPVGYTTGSFWLEVVSTFDAPGFNTEPFTELYNALNIPVPPIRCYWSVLANQCIEDGITPQAFYDAFTTTKDYICTALVSRMLAKLNLSQLNHGRRTEAEEHPTVARILKLHDIGFSDRAKIASLNIAPKNSHYLKESDFRDLGLSISSLEIRALCVDIRVAFGNHTTLTYK